MKAYLELAWEGDGIFWSDLLVFILGVDSYTFMHYASVLIAARLNLTCKFVV